MIGPPSRTATGTPVPASLRITTAWIAGRPSSLLRGEAGHPFHPEQVVAAGRVRAAQVGGHGVRERAGRARVDADLGRQLGIGDQRGERLLGEGKALVEVRHGGEDVGRVEIAERRLVG